MSSGNEVDVHSPRARVVAAFTLARTGDLDAARAELGDEQGEDVRSLLAQVAGEWST